MSKGKVFLTGLLVGGAAAATAYAYFKSLSPAAQADIKDKVDDIIEDVRDKAVDYTYAATDAVASVRNRADDLVAENGLDGKVADFKEQAVQKAAELRSKADELLAQAQNLADQAKEKAGDVKEQVRSKVAPDLADEDIEIVLDPTAPSLTEAFEDLEEPVAVEEAKAFAGQPEVLEPQGGLSDSKQKGLSEM